MRDVKCPGFLTPYSIFTAKGFTNETFFNFHATPENVNLLEFEQKKNCYLHHFIKFCQSVDNAFFEAGEQALNNDYAEAEFYEEMQDLDQMVESFKICAYEKTMF